VTRHPNRLEASTQHSLAGAEIDRSRPLQFHLNGQVVSGFEGDTVLSAALASGIDCVGRLAGRPLALGPRFAPAVSMVSPSGVEAPPVPMQQAPALNGAEIITVPAGRSAASPLGKVRHLLGPSKSLGIDLDRCEALPEPWRDRAVTQAAPSALLVVGGGVAGMTAALTGMVLGLDVTLLEASPHLGGSARLFGTQEGEETAEESIARLSHAIQQTDKIRIITRARAFAAVPGRVRAHLVEDDGKSFTGQVLDFTASHIVLATGSIERLPVFPGNRLPGVMTTVDAFELAYRYGVWPGKSAVVATVSAFAYRLAMLASDAGVAVRRTLDARAQPQSRFIEFTKAYGITMAPGTEIAAAEPGERDRGLSVVPQLHVRNYTKAEAPIAADRLLVCGGFQPDLTLWHMAGGASIWEAGKARLVPEGNLPGMALAGAAAGYESRHACTMSGTDAVYALAGRKRRPVEERLIDPLHETPDAPTPFVVPAKGMGHRAFLSESGLHAGSAAGQVQSPRERGWLGSVLGKAHGDVHQSLDVAEVAAGVQIGSIPPESAGIVAQERSAIIPLVDPTPARQTRRAGQSGPVPPFLSGRFGGAAQLWLVAPVDRRALDRGALIHLSSDQGDPREAVGVVVSALDGGALALLGRPEAQTGDRLSLRDHGQAIPIRLVAPFAEGMDLAAALGRCPGPS
jgi:sarcosine oxidase subunit alpha